MNNENMGILSLYLRLGEKSTGDWSENLAVIAQIFDFSPPGNS
jgi:hypothetical protein